MRLRGNKDRNRKPDTHPDFRRAEDTLRKAYNEISHRYLVWCCSVKVELNEVNRKGQPRGSIALR